MSDNAPTVEPVENTADFTTDIESRRDGMAGWCALILISLLPVAILPVYGRVSASQLAFFQFSGLFLIPLICVSIFQSYRRQQSPGEQASADLLSYKGVTTLLSGLGNSPNGRVLDLAVLLWVVSCICSYLFASNATFLALTTPLATASVYLAFRTGEPGRISQQILFCAIVFLLTGHAVLARLGLNPFELFADLDESRARGSFITLLGHPNYLGSALVLLSFLILQKGGGSLPKWLGLARKAAIILVVVTIFIVGARGAALAFALGFGGYYVAALPGKKRAAGLAVFTAATVLFLILAGGIFALKAKSVSRSGPQYVVGNASLPQRAFSTSELNTRLHSWLVGWEVFKGNPLFGFGTGRFDQAFWSHLRLALENAAVGKVPEDWPRQMSSEAKKGERPLIVHPFLLSETAGLSPSHAHNEYLHAAAERGIIGLSFLSFLLSAAMLMAWRRGEPALVGAVVALCVDAFFNFPLHLGLSAALIALILAKVANSGSQGAGQQAGNSGALIPGFILLLLILAAPFTLNSITRNLMVREVYGQAISQTGGRREAMLRTAVKTDPTFPPAKRQLYDYLMATGQNPKAAGVANELNEQSGHPGDLFRLGEARLQTGDFEGAAKLFRVAAELHPQDARSRARLIRALRLELDAAMNRGEAEASNLVRAILAACDDLRGVDATHPAAYIAEAALDLLPGRDGTPRYPETARARLITAQGELTARLARARDDQSNLGERLLLEYLQQELQQMQTKQAGQQ